MIDKRSDQSSEWDKPCNFLIDAIISDMVLKINNAGDY